MRISDWSSDVCSSDLTIARGIEQRRNEGQDLAGQEAHPAKLVSKHLACAAVDPCTPSGSCSRYGPARGEPPDNASEHVPGAASCKADAAACINYPLAIGTADEATRTHRKRIATAKNMTGHFNHRS